MKKPIESFRGSEFDLEQIKEEIEEINRDPLLDLLESLDSDYTEVWDPFDFRDVQNGRSY